MNCNFFDNTDNLTKPGNITWDTSTMLDWVPTICTGQTDTLYWLRLRSSTPIITPPEIYLFSPHGNNRFAVRSGHLDPLPSFYIDAIGRTIMGDYNKLGINSLKGYLGVNITDPQNLVHVFGIDNIPDSDDDMHNNIMVDGVPDGDKGFVIADNGIRKWEDYIYRNERGEFKYTYNYESQRDQLDPNLTSRSNP